MEQLAIKQQAAEEKRAAEAHRLAMVTQRLQNQLAQQRFGLDAQAQKFAQEQALAGGVNGGSESGAGADAGIYGFGKEKDELLAKILGDWNVGIRPGVDSNGNPIDPAFKHPWRDLYKMLTSLGGLTADQAALLATKSSPESIRNAKGGPKGVLNMLRNRNVSEKVQRFIIRKYFGPGAVEKFFGGKYAYGGSVLAPGYQRPGNNRTGGPVSKGMLISSIRNSPYPVKAGTTFRLKNKNFTVQKVQRTIAGLTYTVRGPNGNTSVVTVTN
jgi:hypothetical protein